MMNYQFTHKNAYTRRVACIRQPIPLKFYSKPNKTRISGFLEINLFRKSPVSFLGVDRLCGLEKANFLS